MHPCGCAEHGHGCGCDAEHGHGCGCAEHGHGCGCAEHGHGCGCDAVAQKAPAGIGRRTPFFDNGQAKDRGVSLGKDVEAEIARTMQKRYQRFLSKTESFDVVTEVCHQFGLVRAHLSNPERTTCVDFEVCIECELNEIDNPMDAYQAALDGLDTIILEFFDSDRIAHYLPIWQSYDLDGYTAHIRLEHSNPALDDEASAFLRAHGFTEDGLLANAADDDEAVVSPDEP